MGTPSKLVTLDGSHGEGGGQILRSALSLSLLTGRPFRVVKIRANRDKPGLRPQHLMAVEAAAALGGAKVVGAAIGARELTFRPGDYEPADLDLDIGTAGATMLVLHTLHLPIALKARRPIRLALTGGTFNLKAPSYPFVATTWRGWMEAVGAGLTLDMPRAGFYPRGGGQLDATIEPVASLRPLVATERGPLARLTIEAGVAKLPAAVGDRMVEQVRRRLDEAGVVGEAEVTATVSEWRALSPGAAVSVSAEHAGTTPGVPATFVGLGERGKPAERVADEAVDELLAYLAGAPGVVDPHSADQLLIPLALADGPSVYTVTEVTEHLRTNARTIAAFLDRDIAIDESGPTVPGRVTIG